LGQIRLGPNTKSVIVFGQIRTGSIPKSPTSQAQIRRRDLLPAPS